ncbi:zf-HC2 domain-containing protein [Streptomyces olivaceiscleroticus]|uniref:Zf-HC2 domain-containing protein n=1 Tax=Streptomyces olivaceiscleroticus TaxID=68245 RepID=A0ABP3KYR2_9ACTN
MNGPEDWDRFGPQGPEEPGRPCPGRGERPRIPAPRRPAEDQGPLPDVRVPRPEPDPPAERDAPKNDANNANNADSPDGANSADSPDSGAEHAATQKDGTTDQDPAGTDRPEPPHAVLKSLLGAWALAACSAEETAAVEAHLTDCATCADEALRLRDAVGLLHPADSLDLDPLLRSRVLEGCLGRRPARIPVPEWAGPYDAETAKLDALLRDMGEAEWRAPVRLRWFENDRAAGRTTTVAGVIGHLMSVDGLVAGALGLTDPLGAEIPEDSPTDPTERTLAYWRTSVHEESPLATREPWREQTHALIRTVAFAGRGVAELAVPYGDFRLPLRDSMLERAFECWVHAGDIADAVDYPYEAPAADHMHGMVDLAARLLPSALAVRRRTGLATPPRRLVEAGTPGRTLHLEVEGSGGGHWYISLDSPGALGTPDHTVAHIALDSVEFCQLAAGHVSPEDAAAGQHGERDAIRDVLFATASLSRL